MQIVAILVAEHVSNWYLKDMESIQYQQYHYNGTGAVELLLVELKLELERQGEEVKAEPPLSLT